MEYWSTIEAYLEADSQLDIEYCRALFNGCHVSQLGAYVWLQFVDETGLDDPGDYFDDPNYDGTA